MCNCPHASPRDLEVSTRNADNLKVETPAPQDATPAPPPSTPTDPGEFPPACGACGYLLHGLPAGNCPECGQSFDPADSTTHTYADWFNPWLFWLPAIFACVPVTALIALILVLTDTSLLLLPIFAAPAAIGILCHYGHAEIGGRAMLTSMFIGSTAAMILYGPCVGHIGAFFALPPLLIGCVLGDLLRYTMKSVRYRQSRWLP
jgi:hypothetical protein